MAGTSSVLEDNSTYSRVDQKLRNLESFMCLLSGIAIFSLMVLAVISVGGRNAIGQPLPGYVDFIEQVLPMIAFLGIAYTQREGGHIRMDILVGKLKGRPLWLAEIITTFFMLMLMIVLIWGAWQFFDRSFDFDRPYWSSDSSLDLNIPLWPTKLLVPISFSVLALRLVWQLVGYVNAFRSGETHPVGLPLVKDVAEQAADEAKTVSGASVDADFDKGTN
jgi:TRAP-type C4-dicarboxylate transport system permease small subunit